MFEYQEINWKFQPLDDLNSIFLHQHTNMWIHSKYIYVCDDVRCRCALPCCYVLKIAGNKHGSSLKNPRWFHRYCLTLLDNMKTEQQQQQQKSKIQFEKKKRTEWQKLCTLLMCAWVYFYLQAHHIYWWWKVSICFVISGLFQCK